MIIGFQVSRVIGVAAELGIADLLAQGSLSVEQLAALTNTRAPLLYRIMRALASRGIFTEVEDGRFAMTPLADPLRSAREGSVHRRRWSRRTTSQDCNRSSTSLEDIDACSRPFLQPPRRAWCPI
jgi:Dimerisation domain